MGYKGEAYLALAAVIAVLIVVVLIVRERKSIARAAREASLDGLAMGLRAGRAAKTLAATKAGELREAVRQRAERPIHERTAPRNGDTTPPETPGPSR